VIFNSEYIKNCLSADLYWNTLGSSQCSQTPLLDLGRDPGQQRDTKGKEEGNLVSRHFRHRTLHTQDILAPVLNCPDISALVLKCHRHFDDTSEGLCLCNYMNYRSVKISTCICAS